jgi:hypothetical protein
MEQLCYFVNSRGILKSCTYHSPHPISSCNNDYKYLILMLKRMFDGMSIYVCSDLLHFFVNKILPKINKKFVLVTGDSDLCVPKEVLSKVEMNKLINSPFLIKWFAQNTKLHYEDKIYQLPIGLDYHTISGNPNHHWKLDGESHLPKDQELTLINIKNNSKPFYERIHKIYVNFTVGIDRFNDRNEALTNVPENLTVKNLNFTKRTENWKMMTNYAFILSPFGNGMDCHRTWESLCLGSIPIVKAVHFKKMFEDLPVLIVNDWKDLTEELLTYTIEDFRTKKFNIKKLKLDYWVDKIKNN